MGPRSTIEAIRNPSLIMRVAMILLVMMISVGMPMAASAQTLRGTSFTTSTNDHTVEWNENWNASLEGDDDFSTMVMLEGQIMIYAVMFIHDPLAGLSPKSVYYSLSGVLTSSFDSTPTRSVEWEGDDKSFRGAHMIELSGIDFVLYLRVDPAASSDTGPIMQLAAAPVRAFPVSLDAMQTEIFIDGAPSLDGDSGEDIMGRLSTDADLSEETASPVVAADSGPAQRTRIAADARPAAAPQSSEYESAANGYTVSYTGPWLDMAETNATIGEFSLRDAESSRVVVSFTGRSTTETNREAYFDDIVARESRYPGYVGSEVSDDRLLIASWTTESELAVLEYVFVDDDTVVTIMVTVSSANPNRYIAGVRDIQLDGQGILRDWDDVWPPE